MAAKLCGMAVRCQLKTSCRELLPNSTRCFNTKSKIQCRTLATSVGRFSSEVERDPDTLYMSHQDFKKELTKSRRAETATHTGQQWQDEDMRKMRYDYGSGGGVQEVKKEINVNFAIDWIKKQPVVEVVGKRRVACTGGGDPALGHPKIYINLDTDEPVACNYCGLLYVYVEKPGDWARRQKAKQEKESQ